MKSLETLFFPSTCKICGAFLENVGEKVVCLACLEKLRSRQARSFCIRCGRYFEGENEPHLCGRCLNTKISFSLHRSCGRYEGNLKDMILLFKYKGYKILGKPLARFVEERLGRDKELWQGVEAIIPVPLHPKRRRARGYNQSYVLAKEISRIKKKDVIKGLVKVKNAPPQTLLDRDSRKKSPKGAYRVHNEEKLKGKILLLVDDVFTTGATLTECCLILKKAGAEEVRGLTLAQASLRYS